MENQNNTSYARLKKCPDVYTESRVEYSLPDYLGDMRRILYSEAKLIPSGSFFGGNELSVSGIVSYKIIYLDPEDRLSSAELTSDYDYTLRCEEESYVDSHVKSSISAYSIRLTGPRRLSCAASIVGSVSLMEKISLDISGDGPTEDPEYKRCEVSYSTFSRLEGEEREYAERIAALEGVTKEETEILFATAQPSCEEISIDEGFARIRAKLNLIALVKSEAFGVKKVEKLLDVDEKIAADGISSAAMLTPEILVTSVKAEINPTDDGSEIILSAIASFAILAEENALGEIITDGYLKKYETENAYSEIAVSSYLERKTESESHTADLTLSELDCDEPRELLFISAEPKLGSAELSDGRLAITGEIKYSGVLSSVREGNDSYCGFKFLAPFSINVNNSCQNVENCTPEVDISAIEPSGFFDENSLTVRSEIKLDIKLVETKTLSYLSSLSLCESKPPIEKCGITVYYPTESDTLFSVAKRYHTSSLKLARDNDISDVVFSSDNPEGRLLGVKKLLIY